MAAVPIQDTLLRHQVLIQRLSSGEVAKFKPFLREMDRALRDSLADASITGLARERMDQLLSTVDALMQGILNRYSKQLLLDLETYAAHEAKFSAAALDAASTFDAVIPSITQIRAAVLSTPLGVKGPSRGALLKSFVEHWTQTEVRSVNGAIRRGVFEGKTNQGIISELRGSHARNYQDGLLNVTARHAEAVVRTAVQHVATVAREETFAANADIIKAYQWLSTLDKRTCFVAGTPVQTPGGEVPIEQLRMGDTVIGGSGQPRQVIDCMKRPSRRLVKVRLSNGREAVCTPDHRWLATRGWIDAGALLPGEKLAKRL